MDLSITEILLGGAALLVLAVANVPWAKLWAKVAPVVPDFDGGDEHGLLELQEHWRCLTAELDEAGEKEAADAMRDVVAPALGRLTFKVE